MRLHLKASLIPLVLFFVFTLLTAVAASASPIRYAKISWCWDPTYPDYYPIYTAFEVEAAYVYTGQSVGDTVPETFYFGDGNSAPLGLTVTEVQAAQGWARAKGYIRYFYGAYPGQPNAGLNTCCRESGLNNRSGAPLALSAKVTHWAEDTCSPGASVPPIVWLAGGLGDTFHIPIPVTNGTEAAVTLCSLTGAGPSPDGMTIDPESCVITWTPTTGDPSKFWTAQVDVGDTFDGEMTYTSTGLDFLLGLDDVRPICRVQSVTSSGLEVFIQDARSGVAGIQILESTNAVVSIPPFLPGTTGSLIVEGTKVDLSRSARIRLRVTDLAGNATECDPILTEETREAGAPRSSLYTDIPPEEHLVTVYNGDPGLRSLDIDVNGRKFKMNGLRPGEERTLDVASAMPPTGMSTITLTTRGKPGGSAVVMIWDGISQ